MDNLRKELAEKDELIMQARCVCVCVCVCARVCVSKLPYLTGVASKPWQQSTLKS